MEKIAIIELNEKALKLSIYKVNNGKSNLSLVKNQSVALAEELDEGELINPNTKNEMLEVLKVYRKLIEGYGVSKIISVATNVLYKARNYRGFLDEVFNNTGLNFIILSDEDYIKNLFNAVVNSIDSAKGVFIYVGAYNLYVVKYNRRAILGSVILPIGSYLIDTSMDIDEAVKEIKSKIVVEGFLQDIDDDSKVVGLGDAFISLGKIAKKIMRYPLDVDNNFLITKENMTKTFDFVKGLDLEKIKKIKGIDYDDAGRITSGFAIIKALFEVLGLKEVTISTANLRAGLLQVNVLSPNQEKFNDLLTNSLENYYEFNNDEFSINQYVYNMSTILFKQLKVMHKLPRFYVKPLRIASFMYDCGKCINSEHYSKYGFEKIVFSELAGVTHRELLIAGFICVCQNLDDFSLNEWIKYKDILTEEDMDAVRKLGIIVKLAVALNASRKPVVQDIVCDILGDSIIMKTVVEGDASYEVLEGMKVAQDYKKVYKKSLQII